MQYSLPNQQQQLQNQIIVQNIIGKPKKRGFTPQEDQMILNLLKQSENITWKEIAQYIPGKTTRQCRERYQTYLAPGINQSPWTKEEDQKLIEKYNEYGSKWSEIAKFFDGRSANSLKNRFNVHIIHRSRGRTQAKKDSQGPSEPVIIKVNEEKPEENVPEKNQNEILVEKKVVTEVYKVKTKFPSIHDLLQETGVIDKIIVDDLYQFYLNFH